MSEVTTQGGLPGNPHHGGTASQPDSLLEGGIFSGRNIYRQECERIPLPSSVTSAQWET